jgi:3-keto-disaccharide hydrolase
MKTHLLLAAGLLISASAVAADAGFKQLFNGKDLTGWNGNPKLWSAKDGVIQGQTTKENPTQGNTFLIYTNGEVADFELRFSYKIEGGNSGVQYRSKVVNPEKWVVGGYQGDFEAGKRYSGILYDEAGVAGGRGIMAERGESVVWGEDCKKQVVGSVGKSDDIQAKIKAEDWNEYVIIARGNQLMHQINGMKTVEVTDNCEAKRLKKGVLALQLHAGPPMTVQFKNIRIKELK